MAAPQMQQPTVDRLKEILADQLLTIDSQARYIQELIAWGSALEEELLDLKAKLATETNGTRPKVKA